MSSNISTDTRGSFFDLCRKMYDILGSEQNDLNTVQIGIVLCGSVQHITIDVHGSRVSMLDSLATILFEAHISLGIAFEKCVGIKFNDISSEVSLFEGAKNYIIDFDYVNHTYSIYDVNTLLATIDNKHKEAV